MLGVVEIGVVEGLALAFVDRAGIAVPKTVELRRRPDDLAPRRPLRAIEFACKRPLRASRPVIVPTLPL